MSMTFLTQEGQIKINCRSGVPTEDEMEILQQRVSRFRLDFFFNIFSVHLYTQTKKHMCTLLSKIEKVPRSIRGEKSSKHMASSRNMVSTIGAQASPTIGVRKGKRSLLACHTRCKCSMETTHNR